MSKTIVSAAFVIPGILMMITSLSFPLSSRDITALMIIGLTLVDIGVMYWRFKNEKENH